MLEISGSQRSSISGRGLPYKVFNPSVAINTEAAVRPRPIHPAFHSQSLYLQITDRGVDLGRVEPGTRIRAATKMITAGAIRLTTTMTPVDTVEGFLGREMLASLREKGWWFGMQV